MSGIEREAFMSIIAPIGIDVEQVVNVISEKANQIKYEPNVIKLTDVLKESGRVDSSYQDEIERYQNYIKAGDKICKEAKRGDVLTLMGVAKLLIVGKEQREKLTQSRRLNIFRQIKRLDEFKHLERTYGRNIIFVGCYASKDARVEFLINKQRVSDRTSSKTKLEAKALDLISTDEDESDEDFGQKIIDCYPKSDFILDCTSLKTLEESCERFFQIYFGHPFVSPTHDEHGSYIANAAAYRSLDLSRQVGAAIFGEGGEIISLGCNEVPAAGGGTYWCNHTDDTRDFVLGHDSNQRLRDDMARDALSHLKEQGWLSDSMEKKSLSELVELAFAKHDRETEGNDKKDGPWSQAMLSDVIEYGRMVHAEMNALTDAARFRRSTNNATLYCTTMPCHMCAKLIIASGIMRVVYVQPYVKSLAGELYSDSIAFEKVKSTRNMVQFETLKGVTPTGFKRAFAKSEKRKRKDGKAKNWNKNNANPTFLTTIPYYTQAELQSLTELKSLIDSQTLTVNVAKPVT